MTFAQIWEQVGFSWPNLIFIALRLAFIAVVFEFIAWFVSRRLEAVAAPFITLDADRDAGWRASRRATLKTTPRFVARALIYTIAIVLVFSVFGVPVLELAIAVAAVALLLGLAFVPILRDYAQGWMLLAEDTLAPGDVVRVGDHEGRVEKATLRAVWLRDASGAIHVLSNRDVRDVVVKHKAVGTTQVEKPKSGRKVAFDPLEEDSSQKTGVRRTNS